MIEKKGHAVWKGSLKDGDGIVSTESGALTEQPYGFNTRFKDKKGTNPEELLGAAHAGCFSMALTNMYGEEGITPDLIDTNATVYLDESDSGFEIPKVNLRVKVTANGVDEEKLKSIAEKAKENCPVSKLFNAEITMDFSS